MSPGLQDHPLLPDLRERIEEARRMAELAALFSAEELLGQLLNAARLGFQIAGIGLDETQRRKLFEALSGYVDVPPAFPPPPLHLLQRIES